MDKLPPKVYNQPIRGKQATQWYREKRDLHNHVFQAINSIDNTHTNRCTNNSKYLALYENLDSYLPGLHRPTQETFSNKLTFNVIRSCIDAVASKIAKNKPKPEFITSDGEYRLQRKAELLTQYVEGVFYDNNLYELAQDVFVDACLWGTGVLQVISNGNKVVYERVRIDEILVDEYEGQYRKPKQLFHKRKIFCDTLLERFQNDPKARQAILDAPTAERLDDSVADLVEVVEAWYLPYNSENGLVGGRHVVCLENVTLLDEEYNEPSFPFAFFRWSNKRIGFYGSGLAEELVPIQAEIANVLRHIKKHMKHTGLKVFTEMGSEINPQALASSNVPVTTYVGTPPTVATYPAVAPEVYQYLENLYRKAYELTGVSQMTAMARKEPGVTANSALQTLSDQQTERFMLTGSRYEEFFLEIARLTVRASKALYEANPKLEVKTASTGFLQHIKWADVNLDDDMYIMKCFPVSSSTMEGAILEIPRAGALQWSGFHNPLRA